MSSDRIRANINTIQNEISKQIARGSDNDASEEAYKKRKAAADAGLAILTSAALDLLAQFLLDIHRIAQKE